MAKQKMIIDCDTGVDDAQAIMMAVSRPDIDVIAITCVNGNVDIDNVCRNTLRVLKICEALHIPVFRGCTRPIIHHDEDASFYHGQDGMGDHPNPPEVDMSCIQAEHAVNALIRLTKLYKGQIKFVTLAPLTNLGVALRMDPDFSSRLKSLVIMGGNMQGKGNRSSSIASEFNFGTDPEAAYMVLHEMKCPITIVSWELCLKDVYPWEKAEECFHLNTRKSNFLQAITKSTVNRQKTNRELGYISCDVFATAVAIDSSIVLESVDIFATVELNGSLTRGMLVADWRDKLKKSPNVTIVEKTDVEKSLSLWRFMLKD
ncbi:nucleoside hydrolase-like [Saccostrea echinata]|uniref:nucleoside hydrolase-like n=1 Tax=Saccostrea echinata TaxID=191078 RepID=UPI002A824F98|nr:nucleoside hydrolase-like [Saccostrea echinata]